MGTTSRREKYLFNIFEFLQIWQSREFRCESFLPTFFVLVFMNSLFHGTVEQQVSCIRRTWYTGFRKLFGISWILILLSINHSKACGTVFSVHIGLLRRVLRTTLLVLLSELMAPTWMFTKRKNEVWFQNKRYYVIILNLWLFSYDI